MTTTGRRMLQQLARVGAAVAVVTAQAAAAPSAQAADVPLVWVGSPTSSSTWSSDESPATHHIIWSNPSNGALNDWSVDLQSTTPGQPVVLYAAPQDESVPVDAVVQSVAPACATGNPADGGWVVAVELSTGGQKIGTVTYAHIDPTVTAGQVVGRWNSQIGTVGAYSGAAPGCWQGDHVHVEMSSQSNYSCFNGTWAPGQPMAATNFLGFVGGNVASGQQQACA